MGKWGGKQAREEFRTELEKLSKYTEETDAELAQNARTAEAEKKLNVIENLYVRSQVD